LLQHRDSEMRSAQRLKTFNMLEESYNQISSKIIKAAIEVHRNTGPGLLESVYQHCLFEEFRSLGILFKAQARIPLYYKNDNTGKDFILDFLVEDKVVVEIKSFETVLPVHLSQLLTYLRLSNKKLGLLINFNVPVLKKGIHRRVL